MSSVARPEYKKPSIPITEDELKIQLAKPKWQNIERYISDQDLCQHFDFLNDAVVTRQSPKGVPLMTTTAIYGPLMPGTKVALTPGEGTGVKLIAENCTEEPLVDILTALEKNTGQSDNVIAITIQANWVSSEDGGILPGLDPSANIFGATGSLYVNEKAVALPVLDADHPKYHTTLAFYGGRLLAPKEEFYMGFNEILFGMEHNTFPDYVRQYAMSPTGGGGLFVERHPFPHIFLPRPATVGQAACEAKVTLGRKLEDPIDKIPRMMFTTFKVPSDGSALAIKPSAIHNDSFTNGRLAVFVADTPADTVAFRETSPFANISITG